MIARRSVRLAGRILIGLTAVVAAAGATRDGQSDRSSIVTGRALYTSYCRSCHGAEGRGDGLIRDYLRLSPPDLRAIAKQNKGKFPTDRVRSIIDGRQPVKVHGESQMPVWGDAFSESRPGSDATDAAEKIRALVAYLESIQDKTP